MPQRRGGRRLERREAGGIPLIAIVLYEGVALYDATTAYAAAITAGQPSECVAAEALIHTREGLRIVPQRLGFRSLAVADAVVLPDGEAKLALADAELASVLRARKGGWTLASGRGLDVAAAAGLTDGRRVAVAPGEEGPQGSVPSPARLVADGRLLTCAAGDALADLVLHYVGRVESDDVAKRAAHALGREWRPFALGSTQP